jgi:hypothetical protein
MIARNPDFMDEQRNGKPKDEVGQIIENPVRPWEDEKQGLTLREKFEVIRRRYDNLCRAVLQQNAFIERKLAENARLGNDVHRLGEQVQALQGQVQTLGTEINRAGAAANERVSELMALLRKHKIKVPD